MAEKRIRSDTVFRLGKTVIPQAFKKFLKAMKKISIVKHNKTVSVFSDEDGKFVSIMKQGSRNDRIVIILNKSREWKPDNNYKNITVDEWHNGDVSATVVDNDASMKEAVILCREWKLAKRSHFPKTTVHGTPKQRMPKASKEQ